MAQTLETIIAINATVGSGFGEIGSTLTQLGAHVDAISDKLIGFGRDGLKIYEDYEVTMAKAKGALASAYGQDTKALNDAMIDLDNAAQKWAEGSRFYIEDVGEAINTAAHAKWDRDSIIANMPKAMELANAGAMDLSDAVKYLVTAQNALDIPNEDLGQFIDMWAYAASRSVGDIETFGQTIDALGGVGRFTDSMAELFAMTGMMHDMGTEGSAAATLLRTTWMRLLAPSGIGGKVLEHLGATDDEINSIRQDTELLNTLNFLEGYGFSAYQANGQAKPLMQTFSELRDILAEISGGYENIGKNKQALEILNTLFGLRGIKGALNIFEGLDEGLDLFTDLNSGAAEGFGKYYSDTMMDTLWGQTKLWESKVEALKERTGEVLAEQVEPILETLGGVVETINNLDDGVFNALVGGLETIAVAGPGLMAAGWAFRFLAYAMTPAGGVGLGLIALVAAARAIDELEKADFSGKFGDMGLDTSEIQNYVQQLSQDFKAAYGEVNAFKEALDGCVESYTAASTELSSSLLEDMLTGVDLKEDTEEFGKLVKLGHQMVNAVKQGIKNNESATKESVANAFEAGDNIDSPIFGQIMYVIEQGFQTDIDRANELSRQLRSAMLSAFSDGQLTQKDINNIQSVMKEQEAILAQQQDREHYIERQRILRKARTLGLDAIREASALAETERDSEWETLMSRQDADYYDLAAFYDKAIEGGWMVQNTDGTEGEHAANQADKEAALALLKESQEEERYMYGANFSDYLMGLWTAGISSSELSNTWNALEELGMSFREAGGFVTQDAANRYAGQVNPRESLQAQEYLNEMISALGGLDVLQGYMDYLMEPEHADPEMALRYQTIMDMYDAMGGVTQVTPTAGTQGAGEYGTPGGYEQLSALLKGAYGEGSSITPNTLADYMAEQMSYGLEPDWQTYLGDGLWSQFNAVAQQSGMTISEMITNAAASWEPNLPTPDEISDYKMPAFPVDIIPRIDQTQDSVTALQDQGVEVQVDGDTQQLQATIEGSDGLTLMEYLDGDATDLHMTIWDEDGQLLKENVTGDTTQLASMIDFYDGRTITVNIRGRNMFAGGLLTGFATGGRATEASIFGEGLKPEWAIPEEHSDNTAALLNAARSASGFSWAELIQKSGDVATPATQMTIVYSPTIHANDAEGVKDVLQKDKAQFEKWFREKQMRDQMEVYA